jgi:release factor glutamine methyltransferase
VLEWLKTSASGRPQVLDIGTGAGALAVAVAPAGGALVVATDVSAEALSQARANAQASGLAEQVEFVQTDVAEALEPRLDGRFDVVVSNPPYIAQGQMPELPTEVRDFEPRAALESGADGLDLFRRIMPAAARLLKPGGLLAVELQDTNIHAAAALLEAADPAAGPTWSHIRIHPDLNHLDRFLTVQLLHQAATQG